ncbi:MAG: agmatine deiminase family protein [Spirosomataceae bacterium]
MTPKQQGFFFPPEWHLHRATWLTFPHNEASWQGSKRQQMYPQYIAFIKAISAGEKVCLNVHNELVKQIALVELEKGGVDLSQIEFLLTPTNDAWCRDHGPSFLINPTTNQRLVLDWGHNAWGGKYPPFDDDDRIPTKVAEYLGLPVIEPGIIMEGGSVEFNGAGAVLTSKSCLLNQNRNPHLTQAQIEQYLIDYYGIDQVLWVADGIVGDDTDGHIDDTTRFANEETVLAAVAPSHDENHDVLAANLKMLKTMRLLNGKPLNIIELPMPDPVVIDDFMTPASYANFYICNAGVIVPTYRCVQDQTAVDILSAVFPNHPIIPLDATDIIWGQGSFHCLSQQEPLV